MIAYLLWHRGRPINKLRIAEDLWLVSSQEHAMDSLYKVCSELKKMSNNGISLPIEIYNKEIRLNITSIDCDMYRFEELYLQKENIECCKKIITLYEGLLFFDEYYEWTAQPESYYDIRYYEILDYLVSYYQKRNDIKSTQYYQRLYDKL